VTSTIYWYSGGDDPFVSWILDVSNEEYPPSSNSISWGQNEQSVSTSTFDTFNTEAKSLGARGVTIVVSSGDNGVTYSSATCLKDSSSSNFKWKVSYRTLAFS